MRRLWILALALAGCGGGGTEGTPPITAAPQETVTVQMDRNDDGELDFVTLDLSTTPYRIVEAFDGDPGGGLVDMTPLLAGTELDAAITEALVRHLADSFRVGQRTELDIPNGPGDPVRIAVFE